MFPPVGGLGADTSWAPAPRRTDQAQFQVTPGNPNFLVLESPWPEMDR